MTGPTACQHPTGRLWFIVTAPVCGECGAILPACPVRSSVTDQRCLLPDGHDCDTPTRFHRYGPPWGSR